MSMGYISKSLLLVNVSLGYVFLKCEFFVSKIICVC